jgi:hypothetical protein
MSCLEMVDALRCAPVVCFHPDSKQGDQSYRRACFCLDAGVELFDTFFNSVSGYRGAYFQAPEPVWRRIGDSSMRIRPF